MDGRSDSEANKIIVRTYRRLPTEILHCVFLECLPTDSFPFVDPMRPPVALTRICRSWRTAALGLPELWTSISIVNQSRNGRSRRQVLSYVRFVKLWLARAAQKPVAISFYSDPHFTPTSDADYMLPQAILNHSEYIRELHFKVPESLLKILVGEQIRDRPGWARLQKVYIDLTGELRTESLGTWISIAYNPIWVAPELKSVVWEGVCADALRLSLDWTRLEELRLSWVPGRSMGQPRRYGRDSINYMLQATKNLVSLEISTDERSEYLPEGWFGVKAKFGHRNRETMLRHLTALTLREEASSPFDSVLDHLQLPALRDLAYEFITQDYDFPPSDQHPLVKFLQRQRNPILIRTFDSTTASISPLGLVECLQLMPHLKTLCVSRRDSLPLYALEAGVQDIPLGDWVLEQLYLNGQKSLCPRLQMVGFGYCGFTSAGFKAFVEGRQELSRTFWDVVSGSGFAPLRAVYLRLDRERPVFVPRAPLPLEELAQCETEEYIRELGVAARIRFQGSFS